MRAMGFKETIAQGEMSASFLSTTVFEARGVNVPDGFVHAEQGRVAGADFRLSIAHSLNAGSQSISGEDFVEDEAAWAKEKQTQGPYVLIGVGPTEFVDCAEGWLRREADGSLMTYDSFPQARELMRGLEARVIPPVLAATTCALNSPTRYVYLHKLERASSGKRPDGIHLHDIRMEANAQLYVSSLQSAETLRKKVQAVSLKASTLNARSSKLFSLATGEIDQLKKFLFFFLSIEIETHAVFRRIDHLANSASFTANLASPLESAAALVSVQTSTLKSLADRFVWCAACVWNDLTEVDVKSFRALKKARDAIAHGDETEPPPGAAKAAELLAQKILWR